jgi:hypothetical protein
MEIDGYEKKENEFPKAPNGRVHRIADHFFTGAGNVLAGEFFFCQ